MKLHRSDVFVSPFQIHLALYSFASGFGRDASKLLYRARHIILVCCGENHPQISLIDVRRILIQIRMSQFRI